VSAKNFPLGALLACGGVWDAVVRAIELDARRRHPINKFIRTAKIKFSKFSKIEIFPLRANQ
jgi:hypothetical protein